MRVYEDNALKLYPEARVGDFFFYLFVFFFLFI